MDKIVAVVLLSFIFSLDAYSATYKYTDTIKTVGAIVYRSDGDYIIVNNFTPSQVENNCAAVDNLIIARFPTDKSGDRAFSLALAAKLSKQEIQLVIDSSNKDPNGYCFVKAILME